ncbi:hypothetical protein [Actinomadura opuntiae]|uniref:hypothetical protein n=1 Tax=Actinomadura sp. OS1-43 TaxID=604315 RepID=UPI00255B0BA7|nr:hypothetical protein [Actinomadura sp. OS1-43]MDL4812811.1 hypothetical protein [Actinomadura sp. OS1-43]
MTQYVVTAPCLVHVPFATPQGRQLGTLYAGALLPDSVPQDKIDFWLDSGMIKSTGEDTAASEPEPRSGSEDAAPPPETGTGSSKEAWVDYAEKRGMARSDAEAMNKAELIQALKSRGE